MWLTSYESGRAPTEEELVLAACPDCGARPDENVAIRACHHDRIHSHPVWAAYWFAAMAGRGFFARTPASFRPLPSLPWYERAWLRLVSAFLDRC